MNAFTPESSRRLCAIAISKTRATAPIGIAHSTLIQRRPIRIRGAIPALGGNQWLMSRRSSASLRVASRGSGVMVSGDVFVVGCPLSGRSARALGISSVAQPSERRVLVHGDVIGLAALDLVLRRLRAGMMSVALMVDILHMDLDDRAADAPGLRV